MPSASSDPVAILKALVACPSVTPAEAGALDYLEGVLRAGGFAVRRLPFSEPGTPDVDNLFATFGSGSPHFLFNGHVDVVPPGDPARWRYPPFAAEVADGALYGRGAVDMKGGIAAFVAAALRFAAARKGAPGTLSIMLTGDEEGPSVNGTGKLVAWAQERNLTFDAALVGEPTSRARLGDMVKIGRRGSLSGTIRVVGKQGHAAYPHLADNPVPRMVRLLYRLTNLRLDEGTSEFQPSNLEVVSVDVGNPAFNVIPAEATARFNVRFNDRWTIESLRAFLEGELRAAADGHPFEFTVTGRASASFLTRPGILTETVARAIREVTGLSPELSTSGGTSDARFFKDICPVVEFGLVGDTMHQVDERVPLSHLASLTEVYARLLELYFAGR